MAQRTGWDAVGYGLGGGFEKDRTEREKIQALDAAKAGLTYDPASGSYQPAEGSDLAVLQQQNKMLVEQFKNLENNLTTKSQWESIVDGVNTGNYKSFNEQMNTNPTLSKVFKEKMGVQSVKTLNPWDNDDQLAAYTKVGMNPAVVDYVKDQRDKIMNGEQADLNREDYMTMVKQIGTAYPIVEKSDGSLEGTSLEEFLAMTNLGKHATKSEERKQVFDVIAQGKLALTGVTDRSYQANMRQKEAVASSAEAKAKLETEVSSIMTAAMQTGDSNKVLEALKLTDPKAFLELQKGGKAKMDAYTQSMTAFINGHPNATPEEFQKFNAQWAEKSVAGVKTVAKEVDLSNLDKSRETARNLFEQASAKLEPKEWDVTARKTQDAILSDLDGKEKSKVMDIDKKLKTNHNTASMVEKLLTEEVPKIDKDAVRNTMDWVNTKLGIESAQSLANVDFNTKSGMMLANYIKEMSGTAAGDPEVQRLLTNLLAGNLSDETYIRQSMEATAEYLRNENDQIGKQYKDTLPLTVGQTTKLRGTGKKPLTAFGGNGKKQRPLSAFGAK